MSKLTKIIIDGMPVTVESNCIYNFEYEGKGLEALETIGLVQNKYSGYYVKYEFEEEYTTIAKELIALKQENQELKNQIAECSTKDALFLYNNEHQRRMELQLKLKSLQKEKQILIDGVKEILKKDRLFNYDFNNDKIKAMMEVLEDE